MKNGMYARWAIAVTAVLVGVALGSTSFTDVNATKYWGKTGLQALTETIDANFAMLETGGAVQLTQTTNVTMHAGTVWTQTWATVFGATPTTVIVTPTELHGAVPFISELTPSNLLVTVEASKNFMLTCIGAKP